MENIKTKFQDIHYGRLKPSLMLSSGLFICEQAYKLVINIKNFLYEHNILKSKQVGANVICVGNITTGGVGKTPIVINLANKLSKEKKVAIVSRGYGAKLSNKVPRIIKDLKEIKFEDGTLCSDEAYQIAKKVNNNVVVITCSDRIKASEYAIIKFGCDTIILDDGFSNRKIKKNKIFLAIDSKMRFGNEKLLPYGPLREPLNQIKRADEIILVDKADDNIKEAIKWVKKYNKKINICKMKPKNIYKIGTKANIKLNSDKAIAFCAIGQPIQFFDFAKKFYHNIIPISFDDHHKYTKEDIEMLINKAKENKTNIFITTQKDETKLKDLISNISQYSFNVLELENEIIELT